MHKFGRVLVVVRAGQAEDEEGSRVATDRDIGVVEVLRGDMAACQDIRVLAEHVEARQVRHLDAALYAEQEEFHNVGRDESECADDTRVDGG